MYPEKGNAIASGMNQANTGGRATPAHDSDTAETALSNVINRLDLIYNNMRESLDIQGGVLSRLYGPSPATAGNSVNEKEPYPCAIACVAQRLDSLTRLAEELYGNSIRLTKLA